MTHKLIRMLVTLATVLAGGAALAAPQTVAWMPNFPMRLGAAGAMGMWMPVPGATEYKVLRQLGGAGDWTQVYKGAANNFQDATAPGDQDILYKVVALAGGAETGESPVAKLPGEKAIEPPKELSQRIDAGQKRVLLRWNASSGASFYNIYRAEAEGQPGVLVSSGTDLSYTDANVEDGKDYWYFVTAVSATSKESKRPEPYKVEVRFPKQVVVKKFTVKKEAITPVRTVTGEDFADFKNPTDVLYMDDRVYVACEDGVQVLDADGNFVQRMPLVQEMVAASKWTRPLFLSRSPAGNVFMTHASGSYIREVSPDGATLVREIVIPQLPGYQGTPAPVHVDAAPDGTLWVSDSTYSNLVILPPDAGNTPSADKVTRLGWAKGKEKYDAAKDGLAVVGPTIVRYLPAVDQVAVLEVTMGRVSFFDWKKKEKLYSIGSIGGNLNQFSLFSDFATYDAESVVAIDSLMNHLKRLKIGTDPKDPGLGDYLNTFADDSTDPNATQLRTPAGGVTRIAYHPKTRVLYALSTLANELVIYKLP